MSNFATIRARHTDRHSNQYFYKTSRTYLRDAQTSEAVDFAFGYTGDLSLPPPKAMMDAGLRKSMGLTSRQSQTPLPNGRPPRESLFSLGLNGSASASNATATSPLLTPSIPFQYMPNSRPSLEPHASTHQATLTEMANLRSTVEQHSVVIQQLQYDISVLIAGKMQPNQGAMQIGGPMHGMGGHIPPTANHELDSLREENRKMKERLATIASAMGIAAAEPPADSSLNSPDMRTTRAPDSSLGKRKRIEDDQLPTPHSTQGSNRSREVSYAGPYFPAFQPGADFPLEGEIVMNDDTAWDDYAAQGAVLNPPAIAVSQPSLTAPQISNMHGAVEFSDDEIAALHFPSVEPAPPAHETIQQYKARMRVLHGLKVEPLESGSNETEPHGSIDMDQAEHWSMADVERLIEEEKMPPPPKEPREPKERMQSTEKYLNAELVELGLTEWIGKDKRDPAYKAAISAARTAHKEAKKVEALARKGLRPAPLPQADSREWSEDTSDDDSSDGHFDTEIQLDLPVPIPRTTQAPSTDDIDELAAPVPDTTRSHFRPARASIAPVEKASTKGRAKIPSARSRKPSSKAERLIDGNTQPSNQKPRARQKSRATGLAAKANTPLPDLGELAETLPLREATEPRAEDFTQQSNGAFHARQISPAPSFRELPDLPAIYLEGPRKAPAAPEGPTEPLAEENVQQSKAKSRAGQRGHPSALSEDPGYSFVHPSETAETLAPKDPVEPVVEPLDQKNNKKPRKRRSELAHRAPTPIVTSEKAIGAAAREDQTEPAGVGPESSKKPRRARKSELTKRAVTPVEKPEEHTGAPTNKDRALPLAEATGQHQNRVLGSNIEKPGKGHIKKAIKSMPNSLDQEQSAQEIEAEDRMMTRHQQRKAQIQKMDRMAQEAMEMEEA